MYTTDTRPLTVLNKREEISSRAFMGILSSNIGEVDIDCSISGGGIMAVKAERYARIAVIFADALLAELEKQPAP